MVAGKTKRIPWNKGLTKETDVRVAKGGKAVSKALKGRKLPRERVEKSVARKKELLSNSEYRKNISEKISTALKGKLRIPREIRTCLYNNCSNTFEVKNSSTKRYCSVQCAASDRKGIERSVEVKKKIGVKNKGRKLGPRPKKVIEKALITRKKKAEKDGYYHSEATKQKMRQVSKINWSDQKFIKEHSGSNANNWRGGLSREPYPFDFDEKLKTLIRERDENVCQLCGKTEEENRQQLSVHHMDYVKENLDPKNLVSLCHICHLKTNGNRKYWTKFFQQGLKLKNIVI